MSDVSFKILVSAGTWRVTVSTHLIFLKRNFLAITDESMKTHPGIPSPLPKSKRKRQIKQILVF